MTCNCKLKNDAGEYDAYAWPGGYPLYAITDDGGTLCIACANENMDLDTGEHDGWHVLDIVENYEDDDLVCDHCNRPIESAYGD